MYRIERLHGREVSYVEMGQGPVLLLIHGIAGDWRVWRKTIEPLARDHTVISADLPGHGDSEVGGGDYSVGALAASLRDLLLVRGHDRATVVGHSLGGGVAMQFAYQFPELVERLVLVSSGGLGREVSPILRSALLPGANLFIGTTASVAGALRSRTGWGHDDPASGQGIELAEIARGYASLADPRRRAAFLATVRSVIGIRGQRVAATDRLYLAEAIPVLIVWGTRDRLIPARHGTQAHQSIPGSFLELLEGVGHIPQLEAPSRFLETLKRFLAETEPTGFDPEDWRLRFRAGRQ